MLECWIRFAAAIRIEYGLKQQINEFVFSQFYYLFPYNKKENQM